MVSLLVRLKQHMNSASPAERELIDRLLANPEAASSMSIHELAAHTFAPPSTITRLCKKLGLKG
ncbi:MurR/RpiR family transcriptional regulator, partial [Atopobium minutum]|uniref:MurR/RpiR family transcriptional regulator n=1 Tax=Atopobium minutum TaxID=1381 RepID=UPI0035323DE0